MKVRENVPDDQKMEEVQGSLCIPCTKKSSG